VRSGNSDQVNTRALNHLRAKIVNIHGRRVHLSMVDMEMADLMYGEQPTFYQCIRNNKRRDMKIVSGITDEGGNLHTTPTGIATTFVDFFRRQYSTIDVDQEIIQLLATQINTGLNMDADLGLSHPFTTE
jgi:hypothetical protein